MRPSRALRAFLNVPDEPNTGMPLFNASAANLGGKAGHILSWVVTIVAMVMLISGITLQLAWGG